MPLYKQEVSKLLPGFRGDVAWIHKWEGHRGRAYWPGGESGVTLDPGADVGHASPKLTTNAYADLLNHKQLRSCYNAHGVWGKNAKLRLAQDKDLQSIRITRKDATELFPYVAQPYWKAALKRFEGLDRAPAEVHTVMLSVSYNRGAQNRHLAHLIPIIKEGRWDDLARAFQSMQQNHSLRGIRRRRSAEGDLFVDLREEPRENRRDLEDIEPIEPKGPSLLGEYLLKDRPRKVLIGVNPDKVWSLNEMSFYKRAVESELLSEKFLNADAHTRRHWNFRVKFMQM